MKIKKKHSVAATMIMLMSLTACTEAAYDENLTSYTLDTVIVEADAISDKFGDTVTEQSYYRTGGDVKVITREEIEKRHYTDISEAIKRIPGITFQNPGYRGGSGSSSYGNGVSINGDTRVIILVDGRRVDNAASMSGSRSSSATGSKSTGVNLDQVINMENVEKIEVIKGPGASIYGADATGGVINIITRKGGKQNIGTIDLSTGSWDKHNYAVSYSGSTGDDKSWHYFISANRSMSGDTKYKDGYTGTTGTLGGSHWKEDGVNFRIDKDFNEKQSVKVWYNYKAGIDGYPLTTPQLRYWNEDDWRRIIFNATVGQLDANNKLIGGTLAGDVANPGYANLYALDGKGYQSFSRFKNNDWDIVYTFNKENGMDSFIRFYDQNHRYDSRDVYFWLVDDNGNTIPWRPGVSPGTDLYRNAFPGGATAAQLDAWIKTHLAPFPGNEEALRAWVEKTGGVATTPTSWREEKTRGVQLQYAKSVGINDIIASITYDRAKNYSKSVNATTGVLTSSYVERDTIKAYVQDKIHITDKWDVTPAVRYSWYSSFDTTNNLGVTTTGKGKVNRTTPTINTQYMIDDTSSAYLGWTRVFRPLKEGDYSAVDGVFKTPLLDEKGDVWTVGIRKDLTENTTVAVHYDLTKMSNAIATLPIWDDTKGQFSSTAVNAKEDKKSFNITADHKINEHVTLSASYSHMEDKWKAKNGWVLDPSWGYQNSSDINVMINRLRPKNHYALNLSYENGKLYTGLLTNWYTGCDTFAFSSNRFLIIDWNVNYAISKETTAYLAIANLTNEAYQTMFNAWNGVGAATMPGRSVMVGVKHKF